MVPVWGHGAVCRAENFSDMGVFMHREVQRILMELLNQMDGFDQNVNVKVQSAPSPLTTQTSSINAASFLPDSILLL